MKVKSLSHVRLFATPWTAAHQASPAMGFSRQEYWSGVPVPSPVLFLVIYFFKEPAFRFIDLFYFYFFVSIPFISVLIFMISSLIHDCL